MRYGEKSGYNIGLSGPLPVYGRDLAVWRKWSCGLSTGLLCSGARALWSTTLRAAHLWASVTFRYMRRDLERMHEHLRRLYRDPGCDHGGYSGASKDAGQELRATAMPASDVRSTHVCAGSLSSANYQVQARSLLRTHMCS
jgi:hypothetical protein